LNKFNLALVTLLLFGCAGGAPKPIQVIQSSDYSFSCNELTEQVNSLSTLTSNLSEEDTSKYKKNIGLAAAGSFLIVPYFFMDLTEGDNVEMNAARARYIHLYRIAVNKNCPGFDQNQGPQNLQSNLRKLEVLYENGTLNKEEYITKRKQIIDEYNL
tara:strand:- start:973 stop:1443 length:471 start_codon:yes stop_codon:yes gene_type:complete